jgi:hypothetical protein
LEEIDYRGHDAFEGLSARLLRPGAQMGSMTAFAGEEIAGWGMNSVLGTNCSGRQTPWSATPWLMDSKFSLKGRFTDGLDILIDVQ